MKKRNSKKVYNNRLLYTLIAVGILILIGAGVYAANTLLTPGVAPNPGHLISEVAPPSSCTAGQYLEWSGTSNSDGGWVCAATSSSQNGVAVWACPSVPTGAGGAACGTECVGQIVFQSSQPTCWQCNNGNYNTYQCTFEGHLLP